MSNLVHYTNHLYTSSSSIYTKVQNGWSEGMEIFNFIFLKCNRLNSQQNHMKVLVVSHLPPTLGSVRCFNFASWVGMQWYFIMFLVSIDLVQTILAIWISSFVKYLLVFCVYFSVGLSFSHEFVVFFIEVIFYKFVLSVTCLLLLLFLNLLCLLMNRPIVIVAVVIVF